LVRAPEKATVLKEKGVAIRTGNYDDYETLAKAFEGADKLLLVSGNDIANRTAQHEAVVKAAKTAGVQHIVYTSFDRKHDTGNSPIAAVAQSHLATEGFITASGIPYTILRNNLYMDYVPVFLGQKVLDTGVLWPAGNGKIAAVTREEMAEAAANVLAGKGHENRSYHISSNENFSMGEVAGIISAVAGKPVPYLNPSADEYKKALTQANVPAEYIAVFAGFAQAVKDGEFQQTYSDVEKLLGRKPVTIREYLQNFYAAK